MKLEELVALGLTEEQAKKVLTTVNENFVPKTQHSEVTKENKTLKQSVAERDEQLEGLKKSTGDNAELQKQIAALQTANAEQVKAHEAELQQLKIDNAVEQALSGANAKNMKAVKALVNLDDVKLAEDGSVLGLKEQIERLTSGEDTKFLFGADGIKLQAPTFKGFQAGISTAVPNSTQAGYETKLADARKNNNMLEVIKIKQEAAADGVVLM